MIKNKRRMLSKAEIKAKQQRKNAIDAKVQRVMITIGYGIVAITVMLAIAMAIMPNKFGMTEFNPGIPVGIFILAALRLYFLKREVKKQEAAVKTAQKALDNAKSSSPESLVQNLVNAKTAVKQADLNLQTSQEAYNELKEMYNFLEETKSKKKNSIIHLD